MTQLSFLSRITSSSYSFQPRMERSSMISCFMDRARPLEQICSSSSML